ncbi:hypothetical protein GCM10010363_46510 [Streptomyces omiyaensis]|nr:hypothetical protein GCM10010363_46510 [Streptomyces omiyaensis]
MGGPLYGPGEGWAGRREGWGRERGKGWEIPPRTPRVVRTPREAVTPFRPGLHPGRVPGPARSARRPVPRPRPADRRVGRSDDPGLLGLVYRRSGALAPQTRSAASARPEPARRPVATGGAETTDKETGGWPSWP